MTLRRAAGLALLGLVAAAPLSGQGIPRNGRIGRPMVQTTRILVAVPFVFAASDSAIAVGVGRAMRQRMQRIAPGDYSVISDSMMNAALAQYGYAPDAILTAFLARRLASQIAGRVVVTSQMARLSGDGFTMQARLSGTTDDVGNTIRVSQGTRTPIAMGEAAIDALKPALETLEDARACMSDRISKPAKARESAEKALKDLPTNGLAHYCLALLAPDANTRVAELERAVAGDSLSLVALKDLAAEYEKRADTTRTIAALQQMLRAAPTDQELRQTAFRFFLNAGRTQAAIEVADSGLKQDPYNWDLWDLKSNAYLFAGDYRNAVQALEQAYGVDSTRADTLFYVKVAAAAEQALSDSAHRPVATDTAEFVKWAERGARRYPGNLTILQNVNKAYLYTGQVDSSVAVARRLLQMDSANVLPALGAAQALMNARRYADAQPFFAIISARGDASSKQQAAGVLVNASLPLLRDTTPDFGSASTYLRQALRIAPGAGFAPTANYLLALADIQQLKPLDDSTVAAKSCDGARRLDTLNQEAEKAATASQAAKPAESAKFLGYIQQYKARIAALQKAYCR